MIRPLQRGDLFYLRGTVLHGVYLGPGSLVHEAHRHKIIGNVFKSHKWRKWYLKQADKESEFIRTETYGHKELIADLLGMNKP